MKVELASGGALEVSLDVDLFRLDKLDRAYVFDLIDKLRDYREEREQQRKLEMQEGQHDRVVYSEDTQVPF